MSDQKVPSELPVPPTIRAWQWTSPTGPLETRIHLNAIAPTPTPKQDQHLIRVVRASVNPVDYKPAEVTIISRFLIGPKPAVPGFDIAGILLHPAAGSALEPGQRVFGCTNISPFAGGAFREIATGEPNVIAPIPEGLDFETAAAIPIAGLTAYQSVVPHVKSGSKVLINGGSGGVGHFAIQIAKIVGCEVTATCSTANVDFLRELGADHVIDYKTQDVLHTLQSTRAGYFDHIIDNVGADFSLYFQAHTYTTPHAKFVFVGSSPSLALFLNMAKVALLPGFLGGGKRKFVGMFAQPKTEHLVEIAQWMMQGKMKAVIDSRFEFGEVPKAIERSKTGRVRGKVVIKVSEE